MYNIENPSPLEAEIIARLKFIFDPEIPVNIWDLGFIYKIELDAENNLRILMTLTAPNCPAAETLPQNVVDELKQIQGIKDITLDITFDPPWSTDLITEAAKLDLGLL